MIKITAEMHPLGSKEHKSTLGSMIIWNTADSGKISIGNYK